MSDVLRNKYILQHGPDSQIHHNIKGLIECPVCTKVFTLSEWTMHKWFELNKRSRDQKPQFSDSTGRYKCVVPGCEWAGTKTHRVFKAHLLTHPLTELETGCFPLEVSHINFS
jgi:hypothetical protein